VQFHWHNAGYASFDDFLARLTHAKRKKIRQERRKVAEAGIAFRILRGAQIRPTTGPSSTPATPAPTPSTAPRPTSAAPSSPTTPARPATPAC
jgi:hypothetical protein